MLPHAATARSCWWMHPMARTQVRLSLRQRCHPPFHVCIVVHARASDPSEQPLPRAPAPTHSLMPAHVIIVRLYCRHGHTHVGCVRALGAGARKLASTPRTTPSTWLPCTSGVASLRINPPLTRNHAPHCLSGFSEIQMEAEWAIYMLEGVGYSQQREVFSFQCRPGTVLTGFSAGVEAEAWENPQNIGSFLQGLQWACSSE